MDKLKFIFDKYHIFNPNFMEEVNEHITELLLSNKNCSSKSYMYRMLPTESHEGHEGVIYEDITVSKLANYIDGRPVYYSDEELESSILGAIVRFYYTTFTKNCIEFYEADKEIYQEYCDAPQLEFLRSIWSWNMVSVAITNKRFVTFRIVYVKNLPDELKSICETYRSNILVLQ